MSEIRANTVLPADRRLLSLTTSDGLSLVAELALPAARPPVATIICLHPLPSGGGMMDSHLLKKMAWRLPALADVAVLRFNTRGTSSPQGISQGQFGDAVAEQRDVAAALDLSQAMDLPAIWLVGWSFGTDLALMYGLDPSVAGAILLSPPLRYATSEHLQAWAEDGKPLVVVVPEFDDYLRPEPARERFAVIPQAQIVAVPQAKHLWVGMADQAINEVIRHVNPAAYPLATTYPP